MAGSRAFVSHSHNDNGWCDLFVDTLKQNGVHIWYDKQGLYVGAQWVKEIENELQSCDTFIIILTPDAWLSPWVQQELYFAIAQHKRIIRIMLKPVHLDGFITNYQLIDCIHKDARISANLVLFQVFNIMTKAFQAQLERERRTHPTPFGYIGSLIGFFIVGFLGYGILSSIGGIIGGPIGYAVGGLIGGSIGGITGGIVGGYPKANKGSINTILGGDIGTILGMLMGVTIGIIIGDKENYRIIYSGEATGLVLGILIGAFSSIFKKSNNA